MFFDLGVRYIGVFILQKTIAQYTYGISFLQYTYGTQFYIHALYLTKNFLKFQAREMPLG